MTSGRQPEMVWGGHASRTLVTVIVAVHLAGLVWLCSSWERVRLIVYQFREVPSEAFMTEPPQALLAMGYSEDDPSSLGELRGVAESVTKHAVNDAAHADAG